MIKTSSLDIKNYECIGDGTFGKVYKVDDKTCYKIYKDTVKEDFSGKAIPNPTLSLSPRRFETLVKRSKHLKRNDGIMDTIYVDGLFKGVVIKFCPGEELYSMMDAPLDKRIQYSKQLVLCAKDLTNHLIYPTDYKLNNALCNNGEVKLVDLDDSRTVISHVPNPLHRAVSIYTLAETVGDYLGEFTRYNIPHKVSKRLTREKMFLPVTYHQISTYIDNIEEEKDILFIDPYIDYYKLIEVCSNHDFKIVYVVDSECETKEKLESIVNIMENNRIKLYDFVYRDKMKKYNEVDSVNEAYTLSGKTLKKVYKK